MYKYVKTINNRAKYIFENYFILVVVFSFFYLIYLYFPYYQKFLSQPALITLTIIYYGCMLCGIPYFYFKSRDTIVITEYFINGHPLKVLMHEVGAGILSLLNRESFSISPMSKTFFLKTIVKFFFFPTMVQFTFGNIATIQTVISKFPLDNYYFILGSPLHQLIVTSFFLIDASIFATMYLVESKKFNNEIKSVEPTLLGWFVALNNYPPFNNIYQLIGSRPVATYAPGDSSVLFGVLSVAIILAYLVYLWATISLGWKAGNLVNRGIVAHGAYALVRHPAYTAKNIAWWLLALPALNTSGIMVLIVTNVNYILRALTEERHLMSDPAYQEYVKRVPHRFIPGIF